MATKKKLRKKLRHQKTTHILEMSDIHVQLDKTKYALTFAEARASQLTFENEMLQEIVDRLTKETSNKEETVIHEMPNS